MIMTGSAFNRACGEAFDEELHGEEEDDEEGDGADRVAGHELAVLFHIFAIEAEEADGDGQELVVAEQEQWEDGVVPGTEEVHDTGHRNNRRGERQDDVPDLLEVAGAVELGGLEELFRYIFDEVS